MNRPFRCYIIDDEPDSRILIKKFIDKVPFLLFCGESGDEVEALFEVKQLKPDLIFLDVQMPEMNGFEFIQSLGESPQKVIMISAYPQYAVQGFEHQILDYLLKPVSFARFLKAANRLLDSTSEYIQPDTDVRISISKEPEANETNRQEHGTSVEKDADFILVKQDKKLLRIAVDHILVVEAMKDYIKIHLLNKVIVTYGSLTNLATLLPENRFLRISRSYIVQTNAIVEIDGNQITTTHGKKIDIGITYRETVLRFLKPFKK
jgi:two-component system LytT family response regulator